MPPGQLRRLGVPQGWTYFNFQTTFKALAEALEPDGSDRRIDPNGTIISVRRPDLLSLDEFANSLLSGSWKLHGWRAPLPWTQVQAIDSTDIETHARARAWTKRPDSLDEYEPDDSAPNREWNEDPNEWPKIGHLDRRKIVSADLQARIGWRTKTDGRATNAFNGYDAHLLVDAGNPGSKFWVPLIRGVAVRPAGSYKAQAGLDLLDSLHGGIQFDHLTADRGYSHAKSEAWAKPLAARGLKYVHDLHTSQRRPHPSDSLPRSVLARRNPVPNVAAHPDAEAARIQSTHQPEGTRRPTRPLRRARTVGVRPQPTLRQRRHPVQGPCARWAPSLPELPALVTARRARAPQQLRAGGSRVPARRRR
ncbi:transposase [Curtobacterium sp. MCPF17_052]|uniref:transposase n=1 Tax=Curtobacterium sp. MCPF17_052 TaxID=2175655 RepID=UPI0024DF5C66|nr:transposase [Curtobacterium sp. MCPF17_052]WIB13324.1 transposase [Curtobacterium sp. MCPF17_052]